MSTRIDIKSVAVSRSTAKLMKTNQTVSYRTGDDGDIEAGRDLSFFTLSENNIFGNTNRFTDELGGQTYTNNIVIDHSTYDGSKVLGWFRQARPTVGTYTWNQSIDNALAFSIGSFTTGWKLPNIMEYTSLFNWANTPANKLNYAPFNLIGDFWSSTTNSNDTTFAYYLPNSVTLHIFTTGKTAGVKVIYNRYFAVTGTTLS
jgi:hypothetical protein